MGKTAFIFPGQGSQYIGMGKDFYENSPIAKMVFEEAGKASGLDIQALCFEENDRLNITEYTQIAMLTVEIAMMKVLEDAGIQPDVTAGLSLGEYAALTAGGVMTLEDVFRVVRQRGIFMQQAVPTGGAMTAVLGMDAAAVEQACAQTEGIVSIANYNCPGQIVITGEEAACQAAAEKLKEMGARKCIPLKVSGPFHSPMLKEAGRRLGETLAETQVSDIRIPYITNVTAQYVKNKDEVKELLEKQVSSSVKWQQSVELMIQDGVTAFIEIGPGRSLSGFMKKINSEILTLNIEKYEDIEKVVEALAGV